MLSYNFFKNNYGIALSLHYHLFLYKIVIQDAFMCSHFPRAEPDAAAMPYCNLNKEIVVSITYACNLAEAEDFKFKIRSDI